MGAVLAVNTSVGFADNYRDLAKNPIGIMVDGEKVPSFDQELNADFPAIIVNGRTMMPLKQTFDLFDVNTQWNGEEKSITAISKTGEQIWLQINNIQAKIGESMVTLDTAPTIFEGRTFVPLGFVSKAMGVTPQWDGINKIVMLDLSGMKGLALPPEIKGAYLDTYEAENQTNYYYHRSNIYKSVEIVEQKIEKIEVAELVAANLNMEIEEFSNISEKDALMMTFMNAEQIQVNVVVFVKDDKVYSATFNDFTSDEVKAILVKL